MVSPYAHRSVLFNIMLNDIFTNLDGCVKSALYADDGAIWMRRRNVPYVLENIRKAREKVETWGQVVKSCYVVFTNKCKIGAKKLTLYGQLLERMTDFKYLGLWLDSKYT